MNLIKNWITPPANYIKSLIKWLFIATVVGAVGGFLGSIFHISIDYVTELRVHNTWIIFLLPIGSVIICAMYHLFKKSGKIDTNRVIESVKSQENVPFVMAPLIFISTCITHLLGGSAGREGAALQLGGSLGYNIGRVFRLNKGDTHIIVMAGMASVFSALFGTPLTAAFFALEVVCVGTIHYAALVPCLISSVVAYEIALLFGLSGVHFEIAQIGTVSPVLLIKIIILAILCAVISILFCEAIHRCEKLMSKTFPNKFVRGILGSVLLIGLTYLTGTFDYNGAGMDVIARAINGEARYEAFLLKIIFTAITIASGFKGGEIVPAFFIGSTFGCVAGGILGLSPSLGAAIGFVALFCGVVNCPIASTILALEVFGANPIIIMAIVCGVSFMMSGYFGLYKSQSIIYSKLTEDTINRYTN